MKQELFNAHFAEADHNGEGEWEVKLIDQTDNVENLEKGNPFGNMSWKLFRKMD